MTWVILMFVGIGLVMTVITVLDWLARRKERQSDERRPLERPERSERIYSPILPDAMSRAVRARTFSRTARASEAVNLQSSADVRRSAVCDHAARIRPDEACAAVPRRRCPIS